MRGFLPLVLVVTTGCFGTVSRWDGEGPIKRDETEWATAGGGAHGVLLHPSDDKDSERWRVAAPGGVIEFSSHESLEGAQLSAGKLYRLAGGDLIEHALAARELGPGRAIAHVDGALIFAVAGEEVALATETRVLAGKAASLHQVWKGDPKSVALDPVHRLVWILDDGQAPVLVSVSEEDGAVRGQFPLPGAFRDAKTRIVLAEDAVALHVLEGPTAGTALLVAPGLDATTPLVDEEAAGVSTPFSVGPVAPLPGNRFLAVVRKGGSTYAIAVVGSMTDAEDGPPCSRLNMPEGAPSNIEGVGWDERSVVLTSGDQRMVVSTNGRSPEEVLELHPTRTSVRHGFNYAINILLGVGELFAPVIVPVGVVGLAGLVVVTSPFWGAYLLCHT